MLCLASAIGVCLLLCVPTHAAAGLTLSPLRTELEIPPGGVVKGSLKVTNATDDSMAVSMSAEAFRIADTSYNYTFDQSSEIINWIAFSEKMVMLRARETKEIRYTISVPKDASAGGRYISMFAATDVKNAAGVIHAQQRVGSLFYVTVTGEMKVGGILASIHLPFWMTGDSQWRMAVRNDAPAHFRTNYTLAVHRLYDNKLLYQSAGSALILPGTTRELTNTLKAPNLPGIYRAVATVSLGDNSMRRETRLIIYIPIWVWGVIGAVVVIALGIYILRRRRM